MEASRGLLRRCCCIPGNPRRGSVPSWVGTDTDYVGHQPRRARVSIADITRCPVGAPSKIIALGNEIQSFLGSAWVRLRPQLMARRTEIKAWYWFTCPPHDNSRRRSQWNPRNPQMDSWKVHGNSCKVHGKFMESSCKGIRRFQEFMESSWKQNHGNSWKFMEIHGIHVEFM